MNKVELQRIADKTGVPIGTVMIDYALSVFLSDIAKQKISKQLVFKGGTALRKCYFSEYRFSLDIDFTDPTGNSMANFSSYLHSLENKTMHDVTFGPAKDVDMGKKQMRYQLNYYFEDDPKKDQDETIIVDYIKGEVCCGKETRQINAGYGLGKDKIDCMTLKEIYAEKIRAIYGRTKARDVYDLGNLIQKGITFDEDLVNRKLAERYPNRITFDYETFAKNLAGYEKTWNSDLEPLLPSDTIPDFSTVTKIVLKEINQPPA